MEIERHRYSVPNALVSQSLDARLTRGCVELLHRGQRLAAHARSAHAGGFTTLDAHMPAAHLAHRDWTPQRLIDWGLSIGVAMDRLKAACALALTLGTCQYRHVKGILSSGRDQVQPATPDLWSSPAHDHVRGAGYYQ